METKQTQILEEKTFGLKAKMPAARIRTPGCQSGVDSQFWLPAEVDPERQQVIAQVIQFLPPTLETLD